MPEATSDTRSVESLSEFGDSPEAIVRRWRTEIALAKKDREKWIKQVKKIVKRYRDERSEGDDTCRFNILWSNVQTLGPAIYAKPPQPIVERRFLDRDPIGRKACRILERTLLYQIEAGYFHRSMKLVREDYLLAGQGVPWIRYEPTYKQDDDRLTDVSHAEDDIEESYESGEEEAEESYNEVIDEKTCVDYIHYEDYLTSPARIEEEITWKAKRAFLTRDQLLARFSKSLGADKVKQIPLDHVPSGMSSEDASKPENELLKKATVWEIWDKPSRKVIFIAEQYGDAPLQVVKDPLNLQCFWPTPDPCMATTTNNSVIPVPDYHEYKDQAQELDDLTTRISLLTDAIRATGVYDSSWPQLERLLDEGEENKLYPVDQWAAFAEKGGIPGAVSMLPIKEMAEVLIRLYEARQQVKNDLYEITGISDIIRGMSSGSTKTATEQRIKGQFANLRLSDRQAEMARCARDTLVIMAEIIAEHFSPETIYLMSGYEQWGIEDHLPPDEPEQPGMGHNGGPPMEGAQPQQMPPQGQPQGPQPIQVPPELLKQQRMAVAREKAMQEFAQAIELLRNDKLRGFRIDVETDSTIEPDQQVEKEARVEFLTAASNFLGQSIEVGQVQPDMIPLLGKMLLFGVRGFRAGRELETAFEETTAKLEQKAAQPQPKVPSEAEIKAQAAEKQAQLDIQKQERLAEIDVKAKEREAQRKAAEDAMAAQEAERKAVQQQQEIERKLAQDQYEAELARQEDLRQAELKRLADEQESNRKAHEAALKRQEEERQAQMKAAEDVRQEELRQAEHQRKMAELERKAQLDIAQHERALEKLRLERENDEHRAAVAKEMASQKAQQQGNGASAN